MANSNRTPPQNVEAEGAVLGASLIDDSACDAAIELLKPEHFAKLDNRHLFEAIVSLRAAGDPVDVITVSGRASERGHHSVDVRYISELISDAPSVSVASVRAHALSVRDRYVLRSVLDIAQRVVSECYSNHASGAGPIQDASEFASRVAAEVSALSENRASDSLVTLRDATRRAFEAISAASARGGMGGISSGLIEYDNVTGGLNAGDLIVLAGRPGMGKALPLDTCVLTPTGWVRMGDISIGDSVIGSNGRPCSVVGVFPQGVKDIYRVTTDDGCSVEACGEHQWSTRSRSERKRGLPASVKTTIELRDSVQRANSGGLNHSIGIVDSVHFNSVGELSIHPYVLGVYLGDGHYGGSTPHVTNPESDVMAKVSSLLSSCDELRCTDGMHHRIVRKVRTGVRSETSILIEGHKLDGCGLSRKFIPEAYQFASVENRIELLRGLCDSDGFVTSSGRSVEYTTVSETLARDIARLVGGLGGISSVRKSPSHYTKNGVRTKTLDRYRMVISFPNGNVYPVSSAKHSAKLMRGPHRIRERFISGVTYVGQKECQCITVDATDSLYVTEGFILTHNSAAAFGIGQSVANAGHGFLGFSLEMPDEQVALRAACLAGDVSVWKARSAPGELSSEDWSGLTDGCKANSVLPFWLDSRPGATVPEMRAVVRRVKRECAKMGKELKLVVVDYIQLARAPGIESREQQISEITRGLKEMAKSEKIAVIALSQLNRSVESRTDKRPMMSDLRESGAIEQDADQVTFVYRDEYYSHESKMKNIAELIVSKQRNGPTGTVYAAWVGKTVSFRDVTVDEYLGVDMRDEADALYKLLEKRGIPNTHGEPAIKVAAVHSTQESNVYGDPEDYGAYDV